MKKITDFTGTSEVPGIKKLIRVMKLTGFFLMISVITVWAGKTYSQTKTLNLNMERTTVKEVLSEIERQSEFYFMYSGKYVDVDREVSVHVEAQKIEAVLNILFAGTDVGYSIKDRFIVLTTPEILKNGTLTVVQQKSVSGKVTDGSGNSLPGVTVVVKGTTIGTVTNKDGNYMIDNIPEGATLVFSFVGMKTQEVEVADKTTIHVKMQEESVGIEEVVAIGYGSMKKNDLTGSVIRADIKAFADQPNVSVMQTLQGTVPGLNVGPVQKAGENPSFTIRGRTSISGEQQPLIILDEVIFRGNLIDINPSDIESIDILKDNSAAAVYGSQAANGVIIITSKTGADGDKKPSINYSASFGIHTPAYELKPGDEQDFIEKNKAIDFYRSRTAASGYLDPIPTYDPTSRFKTNEQAQNYAKGLSTDWYDLLTNDKILIQNHNLSLTSKTDRINYLISLGVTTDQGYMLNEDYQRYNARINVNNKVTDWLTVGVQSFFSLSDYSGLDVSTIERYTMPYSTAYDENGELIVRPGGFNKNALLAVDAAENKNLRTNLFGNVFARIDIPFIKGLSYKINLNDNHIAVRNYTFKDYEANYQGSGSKVYSNLNDISSDNILTYKRSFNDIHNLDITLLYGFEKRKYDNTNAASSIFINSSLGYNSLQSGSSDAFTIMTGAWEEASLYSMARLFYNFRDKYMLTGTVRRDGFSGFSEKNKFGIFPSVALGWVATEESFFPDILRSINYLKIRLSYGSTGNRTIGRYQTLAKVAGSYQYVDRAGNSMYGQSISSMSSTDLKWETTTGINLGVDFGLFKSRISGSVEYYNNNTTDILYNVDLPSVSRFTKFPDNLGKLHNHGIEISLVSKNIKTKDFSWQTSFVYSRNRDELVELLGFDNDGDGKEDDLISEGLFIGEPLNINYDFKITGEFYQFGDVIPPGSDVGAYVIIDQNNDGKYNQSDYVILNYKDPSYRFAIGNKFEYKNWSLNVFINSIQGGKNFYYARDALEDRSDEVYSFNVPNDEQHYGYTFPKGLDYWLPENPNARYQRIDMKVSYLGSRYTQRNFIRLQDVSLSYNLTADFLKRIDVQSLRFFLTGKNLITLTKWPGWDPETGIAIGMAGRPVLRSYTLGLDIVF
jgi:TonB-linked SusC/RagA family outer membrane protein